jgi:curved DNA-binding protein CbpA
MDGQLKDHPLVELIHEISEARLSGALRLAHERVKAVVYFDAGQTVAASMNLRAMRLVELLRRAGAVESARIDALVQEGMTDEHAGLALVRAGLLDAAGLKRLQWRQSSEVLRELLLWAEGDWSFDPRVRLAGGYREPLDVDQLLVDGARALPHELVARRLADEDETVAPAEGAQEKAVAGVIRLLPLEGFVLSRVYAPMRLGELLAVSGLAEEETRRAVYALALGGLVERTRWPRAFDDDVRRKAQTRPAATAQPAPTPETADARTQAEAQEAAAEAAAETDPRAAVEELLERARGATHYMVLGVARSATPDDIKRAYYSLARRLHPDRFRRDADETQRQQIDAAFAKIAQAYETLKDASRRAAYDLKLSKQREDDARAAEEARAKRRAEGEAAAGKREDATTRGASHKSARDASQRSSLPADAEQKFQQGLAALRRDDVAQAVSLLGEAARREPKQARYRAYFGAALARDKMTRRQAESELQAAISLDAGNAAYRVMLAELYAEVGLRRKAEAELERALALDPAHAAARRLLEEVRRAM